MQNLIFVTGNANKAADVARWLPIKVEHKKVDLPELQSLDVREISGEKALAAYRALEQPVMVEDVSLVCPAMGRLPGPFIKFFNAEMGLENICRMLDSFDDRTAIATCCYALFDGNELQFFEGAMRGHIAKQPKGERGFGFDPAFVNDGFTKTRGEMTEQEYADNSHRKMALDKLAAYLQTLAL
jgi:non-canonical purine NTP pyrophosphatase (RdgB/HAM1 family)